MEPYQAPLAIEGVKLAGSGRAWQIAGSDPMAYNRPGEEPKVTIEERPLAKVGDKLDVAPCSVTIYALDIE
jgi:hypothetical protein